MFLRTVCSFAFREGPVLASLSPVCATPTQSLVRQYAARAGTRARKLAKLRRAKLLKITQGIIGTKKERQAKFRVDKTVPEGRQRLDLLSYRAATPTDDVWQAEHHRRPIFPLAEVIAMHRETHHQTIFNQPSAPISITIEMDMKLEKKNRFLDNFSGTILLPHPFDMGVEKKIIAFCKQADDSRKALDAGALIAGGSLLIKEVQRGTVLAADYDYIVAHTDIMQEMIALRGLLKKKFPTAIRESVGGDIEDLVRRFLKGLDYKSDKDQYNRDFGWIETMIGTLDMPTEAIEENVNCFLKKIVTMKSNTAGPLITCVYLSSAPSPEVFLIDHNLYAPFVPPDEDELEEAAAKR